MAKSEIGSLQVFRGLAALAVVAHHAAVSTQAFVGHPWGLQINELVRAEQKISNHWSLYLKGGI